MELQHAGEYGDGVGKESMNKSSDGSNSKNNSDVENSDSRPNSITMDRQQRAQLYEEILSMVADDSITPLTRKEAEECVESLGPLCPNTLRGSQHAASNAQIRWLGS